MNKKIQISIAAMFLGLAFSTASMAWLEKGGERDVALGLTPDLENGVDVYEVCAACHPFYTGKMKYVDTAGRVDAFMSKQKNAQKKVLSKKSRRQIKKQQRIEKELEKPETLEELRSGK